MPVTERVERIQSGEDRRRGILSVLRRSGSPVVGSDLARRLDVSRQVIVQDIALLRARGHKILATPRGYLMLDDGPRASTQVACRHTSFEEMEDELSTIVGLGGTAIDVVVEHPLYGEIRGLLMLKTQEDVLSFAARMRASGAEPLSRLTKGVHLHTLGAPDEATLVKIREALRAKGYLLEGQEGGEASAPV
ncbi:MAG: transcription repressor NadR [candidate division NC10 bacterium]